MCLNSSVGDKDGVVVEELEGEEIGGVESSLPPLGGQLVLYGGLFRLSSLGGNE
jgi:hypothetical protein